MRLVSSLYSGNFAIFALAASHYLFAGTLNTVSSIHLLEFDDEAKTLQHVKTFPANSPHNWITLDHGRKAIYGTSISANRPVASYDVSVPTDLKAGKAIIQTAACAGKNPNFVEAMKTPPYYVFSVTWPGPSACGASYSVHPNGTLDKVADTWSYAVESGAHGLAMGERNGQPILYTADLNGDSVWAHSIDPATGKAKELSRLKMAKTGVHPRHVISHPKGTYLYLITEAENTIHQIDLDSKTGLAARDSKIFSIIPDDQTASGYAAASLSLSPSGRYLWAITRGARTTKNSSQVSCFLLAESGEILKRLFVFATSPGAYGSNAVTPAFWSDEYAVVTEAPRGLVQVVKLAGNRTGGHGVEYTTAETVAKLTVNDGGCCANAVWWS